MNLISLSLIAIYSQLTVSKQYVAGPRVTSWDAAKRNCEDNGMILATFDTPSDVERLWTLCASISFGFCALGFHDLEYDLQFEFVDDGEIVDDEAAGFWYGTEPHHAFIHLCGYILTWGGSYTNSLADGDCVIEGTYGICEVIETQGEEICDDYLYIDDYGAANYETAEAVCNACGGTLATITNETDCECIKGVLNGTDTAWMGLNSLDHEGNLFFEYDDGTQCPEESSGTGACLSESCWVNGKPLNCDDEGGSKCVGISSDGLINDISCDDTRNGILCSLASGTPAKQVNVNEMVHHHVMDPSFFAPTEVIPLSSKIVFWGSIVFVLMVNLLCCYLCLCRNEKKPNLYDDKITIF